MSCRVARFIPRSPQMVTVSCCKCGSIDRDVILISSTLGPHLCPACAHSVVNREVEKPLPPMPRGRMGTK